MYNYQHGVAFVFYFDYGYGMMNHG